MGRLRNLVNNVRLRQRALVWTSRTFVIAALVVGCRGTPPPESTPHENTPDPWARRETAPTRAPAEPPRQQAPDALQLVERDGAFVLHNDWFEATFPGKPWLVVTDDKTPTGQRIPATVAHFDDGSTSCGVIVHWIPKDVTYDAEHALTDARDETLKGAYATLVSDTAATVNGIPAHRVVARGGTDAVPLYVEAVLFYDDKHRALVSASAMTRSGSGLDPRATAVLASLKIR